jgi:molybdopterin converting factor small subunit
MQITVRFFAQLRDIAGSSERRVAVTENATVADLLAQLYADSPGLKKWDRTILVGAGVEFVERDYVIGPNEEIAIMPPVQGG